MMNLFHKRTLEQKRTDVGYIFIIPLILGVFLIFIPNIIQTFIFSINDMEITGSGYFLHFKGFQYYKDALLTDPNFNQYLMVSLKNLALNIIIIAIFSLFIATILNQKFHGRIFARVIFFIPVILCTGVLTLVDSQAISYMSAGQMIETGSSVDVSNLAQITTILNSLNFNDTLTSVISSCISGIYDIVKMSGIQIFIMLSGLQEISPSLYEAASVEGCSKWELFWKITFPMIAPQIAVCTVYTIADSFSQSSNQVFAYTNELAFKGNQYALATAMNMEYLVCLGVMVFIILWVLKKLLKYHS